MQHADEKLKTLFERFRVAPASNAFVELTSALLARGHVTEALRVAEHGLQLDPRSIPGRTERAAALLALGRPRIAFIEVQRVLAQAPDNAMALRLLGEIYKNAGVPNRAAALLSQRQENSKSKPPSSIRIASLVEEKSSETIPLLFSDLTKDLGLGASLAPDINQPVEITQVIRKRGMIQPPRSGSELTAIEGPIVDTQLSNQFRPLPIPLGTGNAPKRNDVQVPSPTKSPANLLEAITSRLAKFTNAKAADTDASASSQQMDETPTAFKPYQQPPPRYTSTADTQDDLIAASSTDTTTPSLTQLGFDTLGSGETITQLAVPAMPQNTATNGQIAKAKPKRIGVKRLDGPAYIKPKSSNLRIILTSLILISMCAYVTVIVWYSWKTIRIWFP